MPSRWLGLSMNPPAPGVEASRKVKGETERAFPVVSMIWSRETPAARNRAVSTCTCSCRSRAPQTDTVATPGRPIRRGLMFQRARTPMSMRDTVSDDIPMTMARLVDEIGWSMTGALDTRGRKEAWVRRSCTIWRARMRSVPGSKTSTMDDRPETDSERIVSSHATPLSM